MEYIIKDKKLIWDFDKAESNASNLKIIICILKVFGI